jgi:hypothetical protein
VSPAESRSAATTRDDRVAVKLPPAAPLAFIAAGVLLLAILAVLVAVLVSLEGSRSEIRTTRMQVSSADARVQRITTSLVPLLEAVKPLTTTSSRRRLGSDRGVLTQAAGRVPGLADDTQSVLGTTSSIAQVLSTSDLGRTLGGVRALTDATLSDGRLGHVLTGADRVLGAIDTRALSQGLPALRTLPDIRRRLQTLQAQGLHTNRRADQTLAVLQESLAVQRETLVHARSLDRKVGPVP